NVSFPLNGSESFTSSGVDPFSFFASFNRQISWDHRRRIVSLVLEALGIDEQQTPDDFDGIPVVNNMKSWFIGGREDRSEGDIDGLWAVFCRAIEYASDSNDATRSAFIEAYDAARSQYGVSWNLTMGLFWIRPDAFLNLDSRNRQFLEGEYDIKVTRVPSGEEYLELLKTISEVSTDSYPAFSLRAWLWTHDGGNTQDEADDVDQSAWYPSFDEYDPGISAQEWANLLNAPDVFVPQAKALMKRLLDYGGIATCKQLSQTYGENMNYYLGAANGLAQRVAKATGCALDTREDGSPRYWPILFQGKNAPSDTPGTYLWKLRPELRVALEQCDLSDVPLHADTQGDECVGGSAGDGDGRRYWWLTANHRIWSFSQIGTGEEQHYTLYNDNGNPRRIFSNFLAAQPGDVVIGYESTPVKKIVALCEVSRFHDDERFYFRKVKDLDTPISLTEIKSDPVLAQCEFCKNPNESFFKLTDEEFSRINEMMEDGNPLVSQTVLEPYSDEHFLNEVFVGEDDLVAMKALLKRKRNIILQGSPGTGKTFAAKRLAYAMMGEVDESRTQIVQFHQNTTYDDFVVGYRPNGEGGFEIQDGVFVRFCKRALADPSRSYFFIIDEINRANISKVFGELLMLIEADHRGESVTLTVGEGRMSVPENLYIIGMMNTADRGLALIDYALRRRFAFFGMKPALDNPQFAKKIEDAQNGKLSELVKQVASINKTIAADSTLGAGFCIGHSYFCLESPVSDEDVASVIHYEIEPLIEEYWFDDQNKVRECRAMLEGVLQ
ncbi:MAG TPA: EVE domain-containing protein, partial [Slackia equolifaciens]|nr:EVE domain-containing protein [Slackia equolifaciens]